MQYTKRDETTVECEMLISTASPIRLDGSRTLDGTWVLDGKVPLYNADREWKVVEDVLSWDGARWIALYQKNTGIDASLSPTYEAVLVQFSPTGVLTGDPMLGTRILREHPTPVELEILSYSIIGQYVVYVINPGAYAPGDLIFFEYDDTVGNLQVDNQNVISFKRRIVANLAVYDGSRTFDGTWVFDGRSSLSNITFMVHQAIEIDKTGQKFVLRLNEDIDSLENITPGAGFTLNITRAVGGSQTINTLAAVPQTWLSNRVIEFDLSSNGLETPLDSRDNVSVSYTPLTPNAAIVSQNDKYLAAFTAQQADIRNKYLEITTEVLNLNLNNAFQSSFGRLATSDDQLTVLVAATATIGSTTSLEPALYNIYTQDEPMVVNLINSGLILGAGGAGVDIVVTNAFSYSEYISAGILATATARGGDAIADYPEVMRPANTFNATINIVNGSVIRAGGGGGGAAAEYTVVPPTGFGGPNTIALRRAATGGGGAGYINGPAGTCNRTPSVSLITGFSSTATTGGQGNNPGNALWGDGGNSAQPGQANDLTSKNTSLYQYFITAGGEAGVAVNVQNYTLTNLINGSVVG